MKKIVEYLPLLSVCLIYFGFCNLHGYYLRFQVDIYAYITTAEIIMAFFPALVFISSIMSASLIQEFVGKPVFVAKPVIENEEELSPSKFNKFLIEMSKSYLAWMITLIGLNLTLRWILKTCFKFQSYDFQIYNVFAALLVLLEMMWFIGYTERQQFIIDNPGTLAVIVVCYVGLVISSYRGLDADKIKAGIPLHEMGFKYHSKVMATNKRLLYVGQATGHLFLYDRKAASTLVFKTSGIDSLVIKN